MTRALLVEILEMMEGRSPMDSKAIANAIKTELAKPTRKPMTDTEIDAAMYECGLCMTGKDIARAVEAFHGIGVQAP